MLSLSILFVFFVFLDHLNVYNIISLPIYIYINRWTDYVSLLTFADLLTVELHNSYIFLLSKTVRLQILFFFSIHGKNCIFFVFIVVYFFFGVFFFRGLLIFLFLYSFFFFFLVSDKI